MDHESATIHEVSKKFTELHFAAFIRQHVTYATKPKLYWQCLNECTVKPVFERHLYLNATFNRTPL